MSVVCSMTGFASVRGSAGEGVSFTISAKSVNHRFLDPQFRFPSGFDGLEIRLRQMLKARLRRGHVDVTLHLERSSEGEVRVNDDVLGAALNEFRAAAARHGLVQEPDLNVLIRLPGVVGVQRVAGPEEQRVLEEAIAEAAEEMVGALLSARAEEGAALAMELNAAMARLRGLSAEVGELRGRVREAQFTRLRARLDELLPGAGVSDERVLQEAALLAERSDIDEENVRLLTHVDRFTAIVEEGGDVGKRLDFLLQELNREANTMLSKTGGSVGETGLRITELGLEMKTEIERAREQVQNLE